jgi:5-methyltetrahydropteroyltriglutamate--homocysteine methyltransferase
MREVVAPAPANAIPNVSDATSSARPGPRRRATWPSIITPASPLVPEAFAPIPYAHSVIRTSLVGSYAQPNWLIDRERLRERFPPRVRALELWRVGAAYLEEAQDDATRLAIADQERAGLDIVTDGEMRRESYSNRFATALEGVDVDNPGTALDRSGHPNPVPRVVGPIARRHPVQVRDLQFLKANTSRTTKMTVPGPFTMSQQAQDDCYGDPAALGLAYAEAVRGEILDLLEAGADIVQVDEPYMQARPEAARQYGLAALKHATDGVAGTTAVHICFGYAAIIHDRPSGYSFLPELAATECDAVSIETAQSGLALDVLDSLSDKTIILGVLDLSTDDVETPETVAERIRRAFPHAGPDRLVAAPDCGMKYLGRDAAYAKLESLVEGARLAAAGSPRRLPRRPRPA